MYLHSIVLNESIEIESLGQRILVALDLVNDGQAVDVSIKEAGDSNTEVYRDINYDLDYINQVIGDWFMAKIGDDCDRMSNTEYVANNGDACPVCESVDVTVLIPLNPDDGSVECESCGATWNNVYELIGYDDLIRGDE
jgi:hypothetical protein